MWSSRSLTTPLAFCLLYLFFLSFLKQASAAPTRPEYPEDISSSTLVKRGNGNEDCGESAATDKPTMVVHSINHLVLVWNLKAIHWYSGMINALWMMLSSPRQRKSVAGKTRTTIGLWQSILPALLRVMCIWQENTSSMVSWLSLVLKMLERQHKQLAMIW